MSTIKSPCTLICSIDHATGYCFGCGRTGNEITEWVHYSHQERADIMSGLSDRMKKIKRKPRRITKRQRLSNK